MEQANRTPRKPVVLIVGITLAIVGVAGWAALAAMGSQAPAWRSMMVAVIALGVLVAVLGLQQVSSAKPVHYLRWGIAGVVGAVIGGSWIVVRQGWEWTDLFFWAILLVSGIWSIGIFAMRRAEHRPTV